MQIQKNLPASLVTAIDISENAIALAAENAILHNSHVNFKQMDFLDEKKWESLPMFDIIISNPPYIPIVGKKNRVFYKGFICS